MRLFNLAFKNFKKSLGDYLIYFFTLILGVSLFYCFNAIDSQTAMMQLSGSQLMLVDMIMTILKLISIFVALVLGFLIIYANNFLLKRRKKEFAMYMLLGMSKWQISTILLIETLILSIVSLAMGIGLGVIISQGMAVFVANFFEAKIPVFEFVISLRAILHTTIYFGFTFLFVMLFNMVVVSRTRLISLFKAQTKKARQLSKHVIISLLALGLGAHLLYKNYQIVSNINIDLDFDQISIIMIEGALGTYLTFFALSGLLLKVIKFFKNHYYKNLNSFIIQEFSHTVNHTVALMSIVCLMLFVTITVLSSATAIKSHDEAQLAHNFPHDFQLGYYRDHFEDDFKALHLEPYDLQFKNQTTSYQDDNLTYASIFKEGTKGYERMIVNRGFQHTKFPIISYSDYKSMCALIGMEPLSLNEDEYILTCNMTSYKELYNEVLETSLPLTVNKHPLINRNHEVHEWFYQYSSNLTNNGTIIVPDACIKNLERDTIYLTGDFKTNRWDEKERIVESLMRMDMHQYGFFINTIVENTFESMGTSTMLIFIGLYLGTTFLIACAALLALKQLCDVADHKERYEILFKLGASQKEVYQALFKQNLLFFFSPLILAFIHSYYGIQFITNLYRLQAKVNLSSAMLSSAFILTVIYGGYFLITYWMQKRILDVH